MNTMGARLAEALRIRRMTPGDLVRLRVLSKAAVYFWLDDTAKPDKVRADSVAKVCKALHINRDWLLTGRGPMEISGAQEEQSQPARLDPNMLAESIAVLRRVAKTAGWAFDEVSDAETIVATLEELSRLPDNPSHADVIDFGARVREMLERRGAKDGGGSESGAGGQTGGDDRGQHGAEKKAMSSGGGRRA